MADQGWWSRHLNTSPQAPQGPPSYPGQHAPAYQPQGPPAYPQQGVPPQYQQGPPQFSSLSEALANGYAGNGADAAKKETQPCPECGSPHYFSRSTGASRLPPPAPTCYTCGYNGMFAQGDPAVWQGA